MDIIQEQLESKLKTEELIRMVKCMSKVRKIIIIGIAIIVIAIIAIKIHEWWFLNYGFPTLYKGDYPITR